MKDNIKNIIFDFGGVVFQIDEQRTISAFARLFHCTPKQVLDYLFSENLFVKFECGQIPSDEFLDILVEKSPQPVSREQVLEAWNAILVGYPPEHIPLLLALKKKYRTFLLSNTNELHTQEFVKIAARQQLPISSNYDMFEKVWYSNELGMRKPNPAIFEYALRDAGLNPQETLFVDDLKENVEAAASVGIQTRQITNECGIMELFKDWA